MELFIVGFLGMLGGGISVYFYTEHIRRDLKKTHLLFTESLRMKEAEIRSRAKQYKESLQEKLKQEQERLQKRIAEVDDVLVAEKDKMQETIEQERIELWKKKSQLESEAKKEQERLQKWIAGMNDSLLLERKKMLSEIESQREQLHVAESHFEQVEKNAEVRFENIQARLIEDETDLSNRKRLWEIRFEELAFKQQDYEKRKSEYESRKAKYEHLLAENSILKQDVFNLDVQIRKTQLDVRARETAQQAIEAKVQDVGDTYLADNVKWIASSVNANNFGLMKQRLQKIISDCREMGLSVPSEKQSTLLADLRSLYEKAVRAAFEREEQARIKAQIREEKLREREIDRELKQLEREREAIKVALEKALRDARDQHSEEVERLRAKLAEAEARSQRAISQAQLTKSGHVYVISNIGSFGDGVYKIGMTRRLEPMDRVKELGDASVPFPFDVHMMISADDAPALENSLHKTLYRKQVNKMNPRKEFFKTSVEEIALIVKENHGEIDYVVDPEALQYRQSLELSDDDVDYIEHVYDELDEAEDEGLPTIE